MLIKTYDYVLAANDHRHAARTRDSSHFIQSVAVFADIKLNVFDSLLRKELLSVVTVVTSRKGVNIDLVHRVIFSLGRRNNILGLRLDKFSVNGDGNIIPHQETASLQRRIPHKSVVLAIDFSDR